MAKRKTPAQLDREIAEVVPAWQRGLDMTESKRLAATLKTSPEELERKQRTIESDWRAALPTIRIEMNEGPSATSNKGRGLTVYVSSPGIAYAKTTAVAQAIRGAGIKMFTGPTYVMVPAAADADLKFLRDRVAGLLSYYGYRVSP